MIEEDVSIQSLLEEDLDEDVAVSSISGLDHNYCVMELRNTSILLSIGKIYVYMYVCMYVCMYNVSTAIHIQRTTTQVKRTQILIN